VKKEARSDKTKKEKDSPTEKDKGASKENGDSPQTKKLKLESGDDNSNKERRPNED